MGSSHSAASTHVPDAVYDTQTKLLAEGIGPILYNRQCLQKDGSFKLPEVEAKNIINGFEKAVHNFPDKRCVGSRRLIKVHQERDASGKAFEKLELANEYTWLSYREYYQKVCDFSAGLHKLAGSAVGENFVIYAETRMEWMMGAFGAFMRRQQVVTIYSTLGASGAAFAINQTRAPVVVADGKLLAVLVSILPEIPHIKHVITAGSCKEEDREQMKAANVTVTDFNDVIKMGADQSTGVIRPLQPESEDVAFVMYTSGTTGTPKGVLLTHHNIVSTLYSVEKWVESNISVTQEDVYLAYLPLAHILEVCVEITFSSMGLSLGYGNPHTLTDSGVKLKTPESRGDAAVLQPTIMVFAPAVLDKVYQGIYRKIGEAGAAASFIFNKAIESGKARYRDNLLGAAPIWNNLICKKLQALLGSRLRLFVVGSAPLAPDIQIFLQTVFNCPVRQGYGLTETSAGSSLQPLHEQATGSVGPPLAAVCFRLVDWPEGNYLNADIENRNIGMPRGEVLIGGPCVSKGYFINPLNPDRELEEKNREDFVTMNGVHFFRTGDIGQITETGALQIIDRKKDLWKMPNGEYVALAKVENAMKLSRYVEVCMCYGKVGCTYAIALICPSEIQVKKFAATARLAGDFDVLCKNKAVLEEVKRSVLESCRQQKLASFETPVKFALIQELWTPENDMLTAAMKMKRPAIVQKHLAVIDELYSP